jgi:hypothetical protein
MSEETVGTGSSPVAVDPFEGKEYTAGEWDHWRRTDELPERFKPAENATTATADTQKQTASEGDEPESAGDPDTPPDSQEPTSQARKPRTAPQRVAQINAAIEKLWQEDEPDVLRIAQLNATVDKIERHAGLKRQADPAPASPATASTEPAQPQGARTKPTVDAADKDGKAKYATYEEYVEDLADWKAEQQVARFQQKQYEQAQLQALKSKLDEARSRYDDADSVIFPAAQAIRDAQIPPAVKEIFAQSEHFPDLCYVVGSDPAELTAFIALAQTNPRAALAKVFEYERGVAEELAKASTDIQGGKAPENKKTTAPKPPSPVSGGSSRAFDVNDDSLSNDAWFHKRNAQTGGR